MAYVNMHIFLQSSIEQIINVLFSATRVKFKTCTTAITESFITFNHMVMKLRGEKKRKRRILRILILTLIHINNINKNCISDKPMVILRLYL